uniref:Uncharacterized protein n=1 Tax=Rhizophora mucronata TaxID=61149 RepID=A0A2P2N7D4_RHIMU
MVSLVLTCLLKVLLMLIWLFVLLSNLCLTILYRCYPQFF